MLWTSWPLVPITTTVNKSELIISHQTTLLDLCSSNTDYAEVLKTFWCSPFNMLLQWQFTMYSPNSPTEGARYPYLNWTFCGGACAFLLLKGDQNSINSFHLCSLYVYGRLTLPFFSVGTVYVQQYELIQFNQLESNIVVTLQTLRLCWGLDKLI